MSQEITNNPKRAISDVQQPKSSDLASKFGRRFSSQQQANPFKASGIDHVQDFKDSKNQKVQE
jgi:hypothetical protein